MRELIIPRAPEHKHWPLDSYARLVAILCTAHCNREAHAFGRVVDGKMCLANRNRMGKRRRAETNTWHSIRVCSERMTYASDTSCGAVERKNMLPGVRRKGCGIRHAHWQRAARWLWSSATRRGRQSCRRCCSTRADGIHRLRAHAGRATAGSACWSIVRSRSFQTVAIVLQTQVLLTRPYSSQSQH